jgi:predicted ester cyclase
LTRPRSFRDDLRYEVVQQLQDGDTHVGHVRVTGTMSGDFAGMPATGKAATWEEIHIAKFHNGKLAEHWAAQDRLGMLQQLGLAPVPGV